MVLGTYDVNCLGIKRDLQKLLLSEHDEKNDQHSRFFDFSLFLFVVLILSHT